MKAHYKPGCMAFLVALFCSGFLAGCGSTPSTSPPPPQINVVVTPSTANVILGTTKQFGANVTGSSNTTVSWSVNGVPGGNASVGTVDATGLYTAPADLPNPAGVTVTATSQADNTASAKSGVAVTSDVSVSVATNPAFTLSTPTGSSIPVIATITSQGKPDQKVNWSVNGVVGGNSTVGTISATGANAATYQAPATVPTPYTVTIGATSVADGSKSASAPMIVAGTIASVTQNISAASGGTITLPDGSSITIPPGALAEDQSVTLSELTALKQRPPNMMFVGVGPTLLVQFATALQSTLVSQVLNTDQAGRHDSVATIPTTSPSLSFSINESSLASGSTVGIGIGSISDLNSEVAFVSVPYSTSITSTTPFVSLSLPISFSNALSSSVTTVSASLGNTLTSTGVVPPTSGVPSTFWCLDTADPKNPKWDPSVSCPLQLSGKKVLILVHGMMSCISDSFPPNRIPISRGYDLVVGFDYDWTKDLTTNANELRKLLDQTLGPASPKQIDIMAHSEGVPVSLYAAAQSAQASKITNFVGLAGPILGTPVAKDPNFIFTTVLNLAYDFSSCWNSGLIGREMDSYSQNSQPMPFEADLQKNSVTLVNSVLPVVQRNLSATRIFLAGGTNPFYKRFINLDVLEWYPFGFPQSSGLGGVTTYPTPNDGIVGLDSALAYNAGFTVSPLPPFDLFHIDLATDPTVQGEMAVQTVHSSTPILDCISQFSICEGGQDTPFIFAGSNFGSNSTNLQIFSQDLTGTITSLVSQSGSAGNFLWAMPICNESVGKYSVFSFDGTLASNNVMQTVDMGSCVPPNPTPVIANVSPSSISVGPFSLAVNGSNFVPGAVVNFGGAPLATTFVSSSVLTATGTAAASQANTQVPVTVTNPNPGSSTSNAVNVFVNNVSGGGSGSTAIFGNKAYVPVTFSQNVAVVNVDSSTNTGAVLANVPMPSGFTPNATAVNPTTNPPLVVVVSFDSPNVQIIDAKKDTFFTTLVSPVTQSAGFSGGSCMICGVLVDPATNEAILDTAQGYLLLNLGTGTFSSFIPALTSENFALNPTSNTQNPNTRIIISPTYEVSSFSGLQAIKLSDNSIWTYSGSVDSAPDGAAVDFGTNIAIIPVEFSNNQHLINMNEAAFSAGNFTAPKSVFTIQTFSGCDGLWTMTSIESQSHILFLGSEFSDCAAVEPLPTAPVTGAPPLPTVFLWGHMPPTPDGLTWNNGGDPHGIAVFTSVLNGKPYGFLVSGSKSWVARIDLLAAAGATQLSGGGVGQIDLTPFVFYLRTN